MRVPIFFIFFSLFCKHSINKYLILLFFLSSDKKSGILSEDKKNKRWIGQYISGISSEGKAIRKSVYGKTQKEVLSKLNEIKYKMNNDSYIRTSAINKELKRIFKEELNVNSKNISTHCLRHTYGTRCIEAGMTAVVLQRLMGHKDVTVTLNTYTFVFNKFKEDELEKTLIVKGYLE